MPVLSHIQANFYDRVRTAACRNIAKLAAKHALRELDTDGRVSSIDYADNSAVVLSVFAQRDRELVRDVLLGQREQFQAAGVPMQLRGLVRFCDKDYFWETVDEPLRERLEAALTRDIKSVEPSGPLRADIAASLAVVASIYARERIPALEARFSLCLSFIR